MVLLMIIETKLQVMDVSKRRYATLGLIGDGESNLSILGHTSPSVFFCQFKLNAEGLADEVRVQIGSP